MKIHVMFSIVWDNKKIDFDIDFFFKQMNYYKYFIIYYKLFVLFFN